MTLESLTKKLHDLTLWVQQARQRIIDDEAAIQTLRHQVAVARLPRFNDQPAEDCPNSSECLDVGNCVRKCSAWRSTPPANNTGD